jgi:hypothetical protein
VGVDVGSRVDVAVAGNQSIVAVGVSVWVVVAVGGSGPAGNRISQPEENKTNPRKTIPDRTLRKTGFTKRLLTMRT